MELEEKAAASLLLIEVLAREERAIATNNQH